MSQLNKRASAAVQNTSTKGVTTVRESCVSLTGSPGDVAYTYDPSVAGPNRNNIAILLIVIISIIALVYLFYRVFYKDDDDDSDSDDDSDK